jgi:hypothetical protein
MPLVSGRLYQVFGLVCGFVLLDYGFEFIALGFPGARAFTSQFLGTNLLLGGSALIFVSLYYLLKPTTPPMTPTVPVQTPPGRLYVRVERIVEEETPPKAGFYKKIEYIGYLFAFLGLVSAADLVLQVFVRSIYNEARWWVEVLLVTFGVLSYTIFGSIGRLGAQEEAKLTPQVGTKLVAAAEPVVAAQAEVVPSMQSAEAEPLALNPEDFTRSPMGDYERHLSGDSYDMFRVERDMITVWREERREIRSIYLVGPYELNRKMLEEYAGSGQELKIGYLVLLPQAVRALLALQEKPTAEAHASIG